jgi:hypothetical protein
MEKYAELPWLAGFWDGEGSVGLTKNKNTIILNAQMTHTDIATSRYVLELLRNVGGRGYTYQERDPAKHRDAHCIRITGISNVKTLALMLLPFAVTKRRHWEIAIEWADLRIAVAGGVDEKGHLFRGGLGASRGYSDYEMGLFEEMRLLNRRGPEDRASIQRGRIIL